MKLTYDQLYGELSSFIDSHVFPKLTSDMNRFILGFQLPLMDKGQGGCEV